MEQSQFVEPTLRIYRRLRDEGLDNVGTVLQAYLYRTPDDLERVATRAEPAARQGRLPRARAGRVSRKADVDAVYGDWSTNARAAAGTPQSQPTTRRLIEQTIRFAEAEGIRRSASSSRCCTACGRNCSSTSSGRGYKVLVATRTGPSGTRT